MEEQHFEARSETVSLNICSRERKLILAIGFNLKYMKTHPDHMNVIRLLTGWDKYYFKQHTDILWSLMQEDITKPGIV